MSYFSDKLYVFDNCCCSIYYAKEDNAHYIFDPPMAFLTI